MDFESPDVEKDFPGLYASEAVRRSQSRDSDFSDEDKTSRKDILGKRKEKKESKKDKGYVAFEPESSDDDETKSPGKIKKNKSTFKFPGKDKKEKHAKVKEKESKEKKDEDKESKISRKESKEYKKESKKAKVQNKDEKKKKENKLLKIKDKKKKSSDQLSEERPIFGVSLQEAIERSKSHDGIEVPVVVRECIDYIEEHGLACEGIYRISGVKSKVRQLKSQYNRGEKVYLYEHEPHIVASLLKQFLRDLPEPLLTTELKQKFEDASSINSESKRIDTLMKLIKSLPNCNRLLLSWIFVHMLHVVKLEKRNKMNLQNVSIVLSPTLKISHQVLNVLFQHSDVLFKGTEIKKYVPPIEPDSSRLSLELPDSPTAIEEELGKQENLLNVIHAELNTGLRDTQKEEKLWEVQRVVTQLKRKLRFLRQVQEFSVPAIDDNVTESNPTNEVPLPEESKPPVSDNVTIASATVSQPILVESCQEVPVVPDLKETDKHMSLNIDEQTRSDVVEQIEECLPNVTDSSELHQEISSEQEASEDIEQQKEPPPILSSDVEASELHMPSKQSALDGAELAALQCDVVGLRLQEEELVLLGDELKRKINSEKAEIERLRLEIMEYQQLYRYRLLSTDSTENSSTDSDESSNTDDEKDDDMVTVLEDLINKNRVLEKLNYELNKRIQQEREMCVDLKVQMKMASEEPVCV